MREIRIFQIFLFLVAFACCVSANDFNMGSVLGLPYLKVFSGRVIKRTPAAGRSKVHAFVVNVDSVYKGVISRKRVGIVEPIYSGDELVPQVGESVLVLTASKDSPYTPLHQRQGLFVLSDSSREGVIGCLSLGLRFGKAASDTERTNIVKEMIAIHEPIYLGCGGVAYRLVITYCGDQGRRPIHQCAAENGIELKTDAK